MSLIGDSLVLFRREMIIFRASLRTNMIRSVIFPLFIIVLFGNIGLGLSAVPVVVVNYANNPQSTQFIATLQLGNGLKVTPVSTQQQAMQMLNSGEASFVIVILPSFPGNTKIPSVQIYYANSQFQTSAFVLPIVEQDAAKVGAYTQNFQASFYSPQPQQQSQVTSTPINGATGSYKDFVFSGVIGQVVVFGAMFGVGLAMITDRQLGFIKSFLIAPISKNAIVLSKIISGTLQSLLYVAGAIVIGLLNGAHIAMGILGIFWIVITSLLLSMGFTAFSLMLSSRIRTVSVYAIASQAVGLPLWFLSGGLLPVSTLPSWLQPLSVVNPVTYAVDAYRYVILQGVFPVSSMLIDYSILIGFILVTGMLAVRSFKGTIE